MNKSRRDRIYNAISKITTVIEEIEQIRADEEEAFDNMPENLQYSMRGEQSQEAMSNLEEAADSLNEAVDSLNTAVL